MLRTLYFAVLSSFLLVWSVLAQENSGQHGTSLTLGVGNNGICFGNSPRHNGLRFNWSDADIEEINGLNFTLWRPGEPLSGTINGVSFGVVASGANDLNGLSFGGLAVMGRKTITGVSLGGLAFVVSRDR